MGIAWHCICTAWLSTTRQCQRRFCCKREKTLSECRFLKCTQTDGPIIVLVLIVLFLLFCNCRITKWTNKLNGSLILKEMVHLQSCCCRFNARRSQHLSARRAVSRRFLFSSSRFLSFPFVGSNWPTMHYKLAGSLQMALYVDAQFEQCLFRRSAAKT